MRSAEAGSSAKSGPLRRVCSEKKGRFGKVTSVLGRARHSFCVGIGGSVGAGDKEQAKEFMTA